MAWIKKHFFLKILLNLICGTILNFKCGTVLNRKCGTILNLKCGKLLNYIYVLTHLFSVHPFYPLKTEKNQRVEKGYTGSKLVIKK